MQSGLAELNDLPSDIFKLRHISFDLNVHFLNLIHRGVSAKPWFVEPLSIETRK